MVVVPGGTFWIGSPADEEARIDNEGPQQQVSIATFAVGKYEVTRAQYAAFVAATARPDPDFLAGCSWRDPPYEATDEHPVNCVSWNDAQAYLAWLNVELGLAGRLDRYRLLSEAEWEYAARGTTAGTRGEPAYWWGDAPSREHANFHGVEGRDRWEQAAPVGQFLANPFGLYDMIGNVPEWVEDCWHQSYDGIPSEGAPWTTDCDLSIRGIRGRGAASDWPMNRTAKRGTGTTETRGAGFRVARTHP